MKRTLSLLLSSALFVAGLAEIASAAPVVTPGYSWQTTLDQTDRTLTYSLDTVGGYAMDLEEDGLISYSLDTLFAAIPEWQGVVAQALDDWGSAADINFVEVPDSGDAFGAPNAAGLIRFASHPFDPAEHKAAHAYYALPTGYSEAEDTGYSTWGDIHYNSGDTWDATLLLAETLHGLGHSLGLAHNMDPDSVMFLWGNDDVLELGDHDLADIRAIYFPQNDPAPVLVAPVISDQRDWFAVADGTAEARGSVEVTASGSVIPTGEQQTGIKGGRQFAGGLGLRLQLRGPAP